MALSPEEETALWAQLDAVCDGVRPPKPKVVVRDDRVKREADVHVSRADPNAAGGTAKLVEVRVAGAIAKAERLAPKDLGVEEGIVNGRLVVRGYWTLGPDGPRFVEVERERNRVVSEYNPFGKDWMP